MRSAAGKWQHLGFGPSAKVNECEILHCGRLSEWVGFGATSVGIKGVGPFLEGRDDIVHAQ